MLRFFLGQLGVSIDELTLTATEAAVAAMLLRGLVLPFLRRSKVWHKFPNSLQVLVLALIAGFGSALDHFAGGNETQSSVLTGVAAFLGAMGLQQGEKTLRKRKRRRSRQAPQEAGLYKDSYEGTGK